jgi:hypothetical protein
MPLSPEELADALSTSTEKLSDYVGQKLIVAGFDLVDGAYGEYAQIEAVVDGVEITVSSGGTVVLGQLKNLAEKNAFPIELVVSSFPTKYQNDGLKFEAP